MRKAVNSREEEQLGRAYDTPWLLPKHKIFISHSGRQKDFAEQLCEDLETHGYSPFFDKRNDSLPKGKKFPPLIFKAAGECLLAIVLISEDFFTKTKWPMLELAAFVKAQETREDLCILPVLLGLTVKDLRNTLKWSESWTKWGEQDRYLTHNVIVEWEAAVQSLRRWNMILKDSYDGEVKLRKGIVEAIIRTMPPDIRSDVLLVQGRERLCKEVCNMFDRYPPLNSRICENATILGVHGIGGAGKSTLCMIITEYLRSEFLGRVCVMELGTGAATVDLHRQVLRQLCKDDPDFLNKHINTEKEGLNRLKERICRDRVFLAIDNVSDDMASINTASSFLRLKFHPNSKVLVTSRSDEVLCKSLGIPEQSCMQCLSPTKDEAFKILLERVNLLYELLDTQQIQVLRRAMELSYFKGYHPLALQLFAAQLGTDQSKWEGIKLNLEWTSDLEHPLFSKIETNYLRLPDQHSKDIFMDIALFMPECLRGIADIICWLTDTISLDVDRIKQKLGILRIKSLLEVWKIEDETFRIHDLYQMLAQRNASPDIVSPRFIYQSGGITAPKILLDSGQSRSIQRAMFVDCHFEMLGLEACTNLKVFSARRCERLRVLCMQRLACLVSLEVVGCALESLDLGGANNLRWLHISSCKDLVELDASEVLQLQHVHISKCSELTDLDFRNCSMLKSVSFLYNGMVSHVNLGNGLTLECLTLWFCGSLAHLEISGVAHLAILKKRGCPHLVAIQGGDIMCGDIQYLSLEKWGRLSSTFVRGLEISASLRVLDIWNSCMSRLPDLRSCLVLQELRLSNVDVLLELNNRNLRPSDADVLIAEYEKIMCLPMEDVKPPMSLEDIRIESCKNVVIKEIFWKVQGLRNLRLLSLQDVRVGWDWELYRSIDGSQYRKVDKDECIAYRGLKDDISEMHLRLSKDLQADFCCEVQNEIGVNGCLRKIKHCLQVFLVGRNSSPSTLEHPFQAERRECWKAGAERATLQIKAELKKGWKAGAEHATLQNDFGCMFWNSMIETVEIKGSVCWIVGQIIHGTLNNHDSFREFVQQVIGEEDWLLDQTWVFLKDRVIREIWGQLLFLSTRHLTDLVDQPGMLELWERMILKEVFVRRASALAMPRLEAFLEIDALARTPRLEKLLERLKLMCRERRVEEQDRIQFAWDWLGACRMHLSLEKLKGCLARQSESNGELQLRINEMRRLLVSIDEILRVSIDEKFRVDMLRGKEGSSEWLDMHGFLIYVESLFRIWKVRQWLQEVASCLSEHAMMHEEKPQCRGLPDKEVCTSSQEMELFQARLSADNPCFLARFPFMEEKAQVLLDEMNWEMSEIEHLFSRGKSERMEDLCELTEGYLEEVRQFLGEVRKTKWGTECPQSFLDLLIQLDMRLWQCRSFLTSSVSFVETQSRWLQTVDLYTCRLMISDAFVWPHIRASLVWAETLAKHLTAQMKLLELILCCEPGTRPRRGLSERYKKADGPAVDRLQELGKEVVSISLFLRSELDFLLHAQIYVRNGDLYSAELKGWWERAGLTLWLEVSFAAKGFWGFLQRFKHLKESLQKLLEVLGSVIVKMPSCEANAYRRTRKSRLSALMVGGGHGYTVKTRNKSRTGFLAKKGTFRGCYMQSPSLFFIRIWDVVNSEQVISISFSQCISLHTLRILPRHKNGIPLVVVG